MTVLIWKRCEKKMTFPVEIPLLLLYFSQIVSDSILTNLYIYRTCYVIFGYNKSDCVQLGIEENDETKRLETSVQPTVNHIEMVKRIGNFAIPVILCMFVGNWSDKFGRKPFLVLSLIGLTLSSFLNTIFAYFENLSPWYFVLSAIPSMLTGGINIAFIIITLHVADTTTSKNRVYRMAIYDAIIAFSEFGGNLCSSYLLYATGYTVVFAIATLLLAISVLYSILLLVESLKSASKIHNAIQFVKMMNFKEILRPTLKKRDSNKRLFLIILMGMLVLNNIVYYGDNAVRSLFLRQKLQWTLTKITLGNSYYKVVYILGTVFGMIVLYRRMGLKETHLIVIALVGEVSASLLRALAINDVYIIVAYTVSCFSGLDTSMMRTLISFIVEPNELGKIYTTSVALDSFVGMIASVSLYPLFYNATIHVDSGLYNYLNVSAYSITLAIMAFLMGSEMPHSRDQRLQKREAEEAVTTEEKPEIVTT